MLNSYMRLVAYSTEHCKFPELVHNAGSATGQQSLTQKVPPPTPSTSLTLFYFSSEYFSSPDL